MSFNRETGMYEGYIYCITNKVNSKQYVGQTIRTVEDRYKQHLNRVKHNYDNLYLYKAMEKYGVENFWAHQVEKVVCKTRDDLQKKLDEKEIFYILLLETREPDGYNMTDGGMLLPNTYKSKPVCNYDLDGNFVKEFSSIAEAARYYDIENGDISMCCNRGRVKMVNGFIWRFKGDDYDVKTIDIRHHTVRQYDFEGNLINTFPCLDVAVKYTGNSNIAPVCRGEKKSANGYIWRYNYDAFDKYTLPDKKRRRVYIYDEDYNVVDSYYSVRAAAKEYKVNKDELYDICNSNKKYLGYIWSFVYFPNIKEMIKEGYSI